MQGFVNGRKVGEGLGGDLTERVAGNESLITVLVGKLESSANHEAARKDEFL